MRDDTVLQGERLVTAAVEEATKLGAELAEAYYTASRDLEIEVRNGEVENLKVANESGIGIRVIRNGSLGYASTSELNWGAVQQALAAALANAAVTAPDRFNCLPAMAADYPELQPEAGTGQIPLEQKIELAKRIEESGRASDRRITLTEGAGYQESGYEVYLANSRGINLHKQGSFCGGSAAFVAESGDDQQTGFGLQFTTSYQALNPEQIGREAASKAVRMLGARRGATKKVPVVIDPYVVTNILSLIASAVSAEAVQKGRSLFAGKLGQQVAAEQVTIIDNGILPHGLISAPFDGEGVPCQETVLIDGGRLVSLMHNSYTAAKDGVKSTGNAARGSFQSPPELGSTNFYLAAGNSTPEEIIKGTEDGLYLTEVMGLHMANPISGDFSLGAAGIWIEGGELTYPVRGMVIAGNILTLLERIDAVGNDLRFFTGRGAPTVRVAELTVSGD